MFKVSLRNLIGHKMRLVTTGLAIVIGVAFLSGSLVLKDTMQATFDGMFAGIYENTDAMVRSSETFDDPSGFGEQRGRIDESLLQAVLAVDGVAAARGDVEGYAQLVDKEGEPYGNPQNGPPTIGGVWSSVPELNPWTLLEGRGPRADDEVVIDDRTADKTGYGVGDSATVLVMGPPQTVRIVGIAELAGGTSMLGATYVMFTTPAAQRLVGEPGKFFMIEVAARDGISEEELVRRIGRVLPDQVEVVTGTAIMEEARDIVEQGMSFFNLFMLVFAFVALFVGAFIIFDTFFITVAQRTREHALLRAIGASRRQVLASVMVEAVAVGLVASGIGVAGGFVVAQGLQGLLLLGGIDMPLTSTVFQPATGMWAMAAGMAITVVAAISPARKASKVPPVVAMHGVAAGSTGYGSKERIMVGAGIVVAGIAALTYGLFANPGNALALVGAAAVAVFFGVTVLGRTVALPLSRFIGWPIAHGRGIAGHLARENAMRNPKRTAATAAALMIGVGLVSLVTLFAASMKASIGSAIDEKFLGDFAITSPAMAGSGGLDPALGDRLNELPEVDVAGGIQSKAAEVAGAPYQLLATDLESLQIFDVEPLQGTAADLGPDSIAVFRDKAAELGLEIGDPVPVRFTLTGLQQLRVAMIYGENMPAGDWFVGVAAFQKHVAEQFDFQVFVRKAPGVSAAAALAAVTREVERYPGAKVLDQTEYKAEMTAGLDQMLGLVYTLLALSVVIALLGIGNTLALSILERIRELGVLRAVGMTRPQLRSAVRWESVIIAVQGTALGLVVGVLFGWALVRALADDGIDVFELPVTSLAIVVVLGALAGVAASVLPARRAARIDVLRAVVAD
jgi:putative ABC transport system permease protein